jgi:spore germination cell wall hydrolase CwlJ-like protein
MVRHRIATGHAQKMPNGDYRIEMPGAAYFYGAEYVERIMSEWGSCEN